MCPDRRGAGVAAKLLILRCVHHPSALLAALVAASGCMALEPSELSPPVEPGPYVPDRVVVPGGPHRVATRFALDLGALVPGPGRLTRTLRAYANTPGATMLAVADAANVAALATLRADLPDALEQRLGAWIDESLTALSRLSVLSIQVAVDEALDDFELESELAFAGDTVTHRLIAIDFAPGGLDHRFVLEASADNVLEATAAVTTAGYGLTIGEHELTVGLGGFAWDAVSANLGELGGIRGTLGAATQCPIVALMVAARCEGGTCVGHLDELTALCERTLDQIAVLGRAEAAELRFAPLGLTGTAGMDDGNQDGVGEGFFGGAWAAELDAGAGAIMMTAPFD